MTYRTGQFVTITYCGQTIDATLALVSPNERSLMLKFDGALRPWHGEGMFLGWMPVLRDEEGVYRDLLSQEPVTVAAKVAH